MNDEALNKLRCAAHQEAKGCKLILLQGLDDASVSPYANARICQSIEGKMGKAASFPDPLSGLRSAYASVSTALSASGRTRPTDQERVADGLGSRPSNGKQRTDSARSCLIRRCERRDAPRSEGAGCGDSDALKFIGRRREPA